MAEGKKTAKDIAKDYEAAADQFNKNVPENAQIGLYLLSSEEIAREQALLAGKQDVYKTVSTDPRIQIASESYLDAKKKLVNFERSLAEKYKDAPREAGVSDGMPNVLDMTKNKDGKPVVEIVNLSPADGEARKILKYRAESHDMDNLIAAVAQEKGVKDPALFFAIEHEIKRDVRKREKAIEAGEKLSKNEPASELVPPLLTPKGKLAAALGSSALGA